MYHPGMSHGYPLPTGDFFRALVEHASDMIFVIDSEGGIRYVNSQVVSVLGYRPAEVASKTFFELVHEEDRVAVTRAFDNELRIPGAQISFGVRMQCQGERWRTIDSVARNLSGESAVGGIVVTAREVMARPLTRRVVKRRAMDDISGYVTVDSEGRIIGCNPAFMRTFGFESEEQARVASFWDLFPQPELRQNLATMLAKLGKVESLEVEGARSDGLPLYLLVNLIGTLGRDGDIERIEAQVLDISEKRKLEEQVRRAQRMESLGRMSCGVAHDFNNLLTAILGYAEILKGKMSSDAPAQVQIEEICKAGSRAASLTRQLLTFGKGKVVDVEVLQLNTVIADMETMLKQLVGDRIELILELGSGLAPVEIDRSQLEQVILNLVVNARDAMDGCGRLMLRSVDHRVEQPFVLHHDSVQPGDYTMLEVQDTGCGIEPAIMEHLFEPFFTTKETGKGTGLGLSTVYGIVNKNGGFLSVYNELEGGVTFKVSFPRH